MLKDRLSKKQRLNGMFKNWGWAAAARPRVAVPGFCTRPALQSPSVTFHVIAGCSSVPGELIWACSLKPLSDLQSLEKEKVLFIKTFWFLPHNTFIYGKAMTVTETGCKITHSTVSEVLLHWKWKACLALPIQHMQQVRKKSCIWYSINKVCGVW